MDARIHAANAALDVLDLRAAAQMALDYLAHDYRLLLRSYCLIGEDNEPLRDSAESVEHDHLCQIEGVIDALTAALPPSQEPRT
jgi:hypothetical protein